MSYAPWRTLAPGATIAVVAPSGPPSAASADATPGLIASWGWQPRMYPSTAARGGYLAGPDEQRAADLRAAYEDDSVDAIWCIRGGYGAGRLLPLLPGGLAQRHPKPLLGYSDITALHAWLDGQGQLALHAPMPGSDLVKPERADDVAAITAWLRDGLPAGTELRAPQPDATLHVGGRASGRLAGGNLTLLAMLVGTPWQPDWRGRIVFFEEVGEEPYRIDRLLLQLRLSGALDAAAGFIVGSFTDADYPRDELMRGLAALGKPLVANWPTGHGTPNRPLPLGAQVTLDADAALLRIDQDVLLPGRHMSIDRDL
ncbi:MAG: LD-carboxypeptidase [Aquabacterium sp.]